MRSVHSAALVSFDTDHDPSLFLHTGIFQGSRPYNLELSDCFLMSTFSPTSEN